MSEQTCLYCGAEMDYENPARVEFKCNSAKYRDGLFVRDFDCYERQIEQLKQEVLDEREACAKLCDRLAWQNGDICASRIRARGEVK